ncbi:MAG: hypothetical protein EZS28_029164 [Streblomastix strix]|uniref:Uncharacterized protein n=1 Tax=Streblomastix strix TaxID=222440 RepID=A0A5J4UY08_9EUKA|nr:MAG: hypothetical protein EZS28_029164 [Streblomastix strix]
MNSYGNFNLAGIADFSVVADALAFEPLPRYLVICHSSLYKLLRIRATSNFEELNPITGTSQCYGIVSSSYLGSSIEICFELSPNDSLTILSTVSISYVIQYLVAQVINLSLWSYKPIPHRQDNILNKSRPQHRQYKKRVLFLIR